MEWKVFHASEWQLLKVTDNCCIWDVGVSLKSHNRVVPPLP